MGRHPASCLGCLCFRAEDARRRVVADRARMSVRAGVTPDDDPEGPPAATPRLGVGLRVGVPVRRFSLRRPRTARPPLGFGAFPAEGG